MAQNPTKFKPILHNGIVSKPAIIGNKKSSQNLPIIVGLGKVLGMESL